MQLSKHRCISYFETNCSTKPYPSLLQELAQLARSGDAQALTCFKQLFTTRTHVWLEFTVSERALIVKGLVELLDVLGSVPLVCYVSAR